MFAVMGTKMLMGGEAAFDAVRYTTFSVQNQSVSVKVPAPEVALNW